MWATTPHDGGGAMEASHQTGGQLGTRTPDHPDDVRRRRAPRRLGLVAGTWARPCRIAIRCAGLQRVDLPAGDRRVDLRRLDRRQRADRQRAPVRRHVSTSPRVRHPARARRHLHERGAMRLLQEAGEGRHQGNGHRGRRHELAADREPADRRWSADRRRLRRGHRGHQRAEQPRHAPGTRRNGRVGPARSRRSCGTP